MTEKRIAIILDANGAAMIGEFDQATGAVKKLENATEALQQASQRSGAEADRSSSKWEAAGKKIGLGVAAVVTGFGLMVSNAIKTADETGKLATKLGVTTEFISEMGYAAKATGADAKLLESGLFGLAEQAVKAEAGAKRPAAAFKALGVDVRDAHGNLKSLEILLPEVANRFQKMQAGPKEAALATALFGNEAKALLPLLNEGADGMDELRERAQQLGVSIGSDLSQSAAGTLDKLEDLKQRTVGWALTIAGDLLPYADQLLDWLMDATQEGGASTEVFRGLGYVIDGAGTIIKGAIGFFDGLASAISSFTGKTETAASVLGNLLRLVGQTGTVLGSAADMLGGAVKQGAGMLTGDAGLKAEGTFQIRQAERRGNAALFNRPDFSNVRTGPQYDWSNVSNKAPPKTVEAPSLRELLGPTPRKPKDDSKQRDAEDKRRADAIARYNEEALKLAATLEGPLKVAQVEYDLREKKLNDEKEKGNITLAAYTSLMASAKQQRDDAIARLEKQGNVLARVHRDYDRELQLVGLSTQQRRVEETVLRAVAEAHEEAVRQKRKELELSPQQIAQLRAEVTAYEQQIEAKQAQVQYAEDVKSAWLGAASNATRAWGDFLASGLKGGKDFARSLKDTFKRLVSDLATMFLDNTLVRPFKQMLDGVLSGGFASAGQSMGAGGGNLLGNLFNGVLDKVGSWFGFGGKGNAAGYAQPGAWMHGYGGASQPLAPGAGVLAPQYGGGTLAGGGKFAGMNPWLGAAAGAAMGWGLGGDTPGKLGGAAAGGLLGFGALGAAGSIMGGGGLAGAFGVGTAGLGAFGAAGWIGLAALAVNAISGGKLFGTKYKTESGAQQFDIGSGGATGYTSTTEVKQKSFFRGRQWRTTQSALDADAQGAINELFESLQKTLVEASGKLGVAVPALVGGSFRREFDAKGNLTKEFGTIAGRVYAEAQDAFAARLVGENLLAVAKLVGGASEIERLAGDYRTSGETLQGFATFMLAVQSDIKNAQALWTQSGDGVLTMITQKIAGLASAGESLADAYARIADATRKYGDLIGGVDKEIITSGLSERARAEVEVELAYRAQVKEANALAKSLGLAGARSEDLAKIEQLRAIRMADVVRQYEAQKSAFLDDALLSGLSPLRDAEKLSEAKRQYQQAVSSGDQQRAEQLYQTVLGLGRNLYASGQDYNDLHAWATDLMKGMSGGEQQTGLVVDELKRISDLLEQGPLATAQALFSLLGQPVGNPAGQASTTPITAPRIPATGQPVGDPRLLDAIERQTEESRETNRLLRRVMEEDALYR